MSVTPSPVEYSSKEMNRGFQMQDRERSGSFSRKSSMGPSEDELVSMTDNKYSRKRLTTGFTTEHIVVEKSQKSFIATLVQNIYFQIFITLLTLVSLVLYDVKTIFLTKEQDFSIGIVNMVFFGVFMIQILMNIKTEGYFCSFYFYLDLISTITLLLDVDLITDALFNSGSSGSSFQVNAIIAQSKASRAAARAVRVVKIFRLARVAKLYKSTQKARELNELQKKEKKISPIIKKVQIEEHSDKDLSESGREKKRMPLESIHNFTKYQLQNDSIKEEDVGPVEHIIDSKENMEDDDASNSSKIHLKCIQQLQDHPLRKDEEQSQNKESNISKILSDDTIKRIIIIILILMTSIPLMDLGNYVTLTTHWDMMTVFVAKAIQNNKVSVAQINTFIHSQVNHFGTAGVYSSILCIDTPFNQISQCPISDFNSYRSNDIGLFFQTFDIAAIMAARSDLTLKETALINQSSDSIAVFLDYSEYNRIDAIFSIVTTLFICLTIMYLLTSFSNNINELIISPIEKMLMLVKSKDSNEEIEDSDNKEGEEYETQIVQDAIIKIKNLMETIFGALGNQLIHSKMGNQNQIQSNLDQSINKTLCVFAFCQINHLATITQVLADDVYGFVNEICLIVQNSVFRYGGYCTKIMSDGFLLTFKVPRQKWIHLGIRQGMNPCKMSRSLGPNEANHLRITCDYSFFSALKILARLCKEPKIFKYRNDQRLLATFKKAFSVEMSFALNFGWANQGIVGSRYKIDPLFFGPEISKLKKLIKFTKDKGSSIVISESLYSNFTEGCKQYCRPYESIRLSQAEKIQRIYMVDFSVMNVAPSRHRGQKKDKMRKDLKTKKQQNMAYMDQAQLCNYNSGQILKGKKELRQILEKRLSEQSKRKYRAGFEHYIKGEWEDALEFLSYQKLSADPLTLRLKEFIKAHKSVAPADWKGFREFSNEVYE